MRARSEAGALRGGRIAGPHRRPDTGRRQAAFGRQRLEFGEGRVEVAPDVVAQRFERRHVDDIDVVPKPAGQTGDEEPIQTDQKCGERLARTGGGGHEHVITGLDTWPGFQL